MDVGKIRFAAWGRGHAVSDIVYGRCCLMDYRPIAEQKNL